MICKKRWAVLVTFTELHLHQTEYRDSAFAFLKWPDLGMLMTGCQKPIFTNGALPGWMMTHVILMGSFVKASNVSVGC